MMNNDAISRSEALELLCDGCNARNKTPVPRCGDVCSDFKALLALPALDVAPVVHYQDTGSTVIKAEDINEWQDRIIIDDGESHSCAIYYQENENTVDVVRCRDCKHWVPCHGKELEGHMYCEWAGWLVGENAYCIYGERKGHADNYPSGEQ